MIVQRLPRPVNTRDCKMYTQNLSNKCVGHKSITPIILCRTFKLLDEREYGERIRLKKTVSMPFNVWFYIIMLLQKWYFIIMKSKSSLLLNHS